jgi:hypothetical protein
MANIIWEAAPRPLNHAERWEWPCAVYAGPSKKLAAFIISESECSDAGLNGVSPAKPLQVIVCRYNTGLKGKGGVDYRRMMMRERYFSSLAEAMAWTQAFLETNREWHPLIV